MADQNIKYDAIVVGGGMAGGWAAKEFCDRGFKTLMLERGREVKHLKDYPTANLRPWEFKYKGDLTYEMKKDNPMITKCYAFRQDAHHFFVKDKEHPYVSKSPFDWIRGYQTGGRSIMWARQTQRWSDYDFEGPKRDNFAVDWPIRHKDLDEWYNKVEHFIGVSGNKDGLDMLPDGDFLKPWDLNCVEEHFRDKMNEHYTDRHVIYARCAHLSEVRDIHRQQGRGACMSRQLCQRGCPLGGFFSSNSSVIPWAQKTGNLTLRAHSVVHSVIYDDATGKATGVKVIDANTKEELEFKAKVVFVNAGTLNTNLIMLNSKSERFPNGIANDTGILGKYIAFHNYRARISARHDGHLDSKSEGRKPTHAYVPRFINLKKHDQEFKRGYACTFNAGRYGRPSQAGFGEELKNNLLGEPELGDWRVSSQMMGETIPKETNLVTLSETEKDQWGIPLLEIDITYDDNDEKMIESFMKEYTEMFEKAGFKDIRTQDNGRFPGNDIHEMGGVRMGHDAKTSILNKWNQMHLVPNVFITDGACMTSVSTQNPSLTFMAMSARAANYAMDQMEEGVL